MLVSIYSISFKIYAEFTIISMLNSPLLGSVSPHKFSAPFLDSVPTFTPPPKSSSEQFHILDSLAAAGLPSHEFWKLFSQCCVCKNFMTTRSTDYHRCPGAGKSPPEYIKYHPINTPIDSDAQKTKVDAKNISNFLSLLDTYRGTGSTVGSGGGVSNTVFEKIFCVCKGCGFYMTRRVAGDHTCSSEARSHWDFNPFL